MAMQYLSGVDPSEMGKVKGKLIKKVAAKTKAVTKKVATKAKAAAKKVVRVSATPVREAFKVLLDVNFLGFAVKLKKAMAKDPKKTLEFWKKFGGDQKGLNTAIGRGIKHYEKHKGKKKVSGCISGTEDYDGEMGVVVAASVTAAATAAAPLIIALKPLLTGILGKKEAEAGETPEDAAVLDEAKDSFKEQVQEIASEPEPEPVKEVEPEPVKQIQSEPEPTKAVERSPIVAPQKSVVRTKKAVTKPKKGKVKIDENPEYIWYKDKRIWIGVGSFAALAAIVGVAVKMSHRKQ